MPTDIGKQFDYERCPKHPARQVVNSGVCTTRFCAECIEQHKQNYADRRDPGFSIRYQDERSTDGRSIYKDHQGYYRRTDSERNDV